LYTSKQILKSTRWRTSNQCRSSRRVGVMLSHFRFLTTRRAAAVITDHCIDYSEVVRHTGSSRCQVAVRCAACAVDFVNCCAPCTSDVSQVHNAPKRVFSCGSAPGLHRGSLWCSPRPWREGYSLLIASSLHRRLGRLDLSISIDSTATSLATNYLHCPRRVQYITLGMS